MEINIDQLLKGKATKIREAEYYPTAKYIEPFIERMNKIPGIKYKAEVELPKQITYTKKDDIDFDDITYNRVWLQAILPEEFDMEDHEQVIGLVYGLDVRKPIIKFYKGGLNNACTNLCVFNPESLFVQELKESINYKTIDFLVEQTNELHVFLTHLHGITITPDDRDEALGSWIRKCINYSYSNGISKAKLSTSLAVEAYKLLFVNTESEYFVDTNETADMFTIYNAFTDLITHKDKDIINKCEKVLALKSILALE